MNLLVLTTPTGPALLGVRVASPEASQLGTSRPGATEAAYLRALCVGAPSVPGVWLVGREGCRRAEPRDMADWAYGHGWIRTCDRAPIEWPQ